ncbi:MAG TPA: ABC transporter permease [Candidatus Polarisedimenticolaceae bacterium]|nr:ABC transporter permease [Candidatus Polarisedimenticolaceae bacterium]
MRSLPVIVSLFLRASRLQKKRAVLTIAAIAWGSVSLLLLLAFGEGLKNQMATARRGMGEGIAVLWAGQTTKAWQGLPPGRQINFAIDDVEILRSRVPILDGVIGENRTWSANFVVGKTTLNAQINGVHADYGRLRNHEPAPGGRFLNDHDVALRRRVVFLGDKLAKDLFAAEDPIGRGLLINNVPYTVIGVMKHRMQMGTYGGPDEGHAVVPITTFRAQFGDWPLANLVIRPKDPNQMSLALAEVRKVLAGKYKFDPEDTRVIQDWDTVKGAKVMTNILLGIQIFLGIIGGLTLMIGGVGVANIMYATVKERTREIGVKMALGARRSWITGPLLLEGLAYTVVGGLFGVVIATVLIILMGLIPTQGNQALEFLGKPTLSPAVGLVSAAILGLIGLIAAYFPARRAASIDPAQTLRYE